MWVPERVALCVRLRAYSLANQARNAYAPCCEVICGPIGLHYIFRHYLINGAIFGKELLNVKRVFSFSLELLLKPFLILSVI